LLWKQQVYAKFPLLLVFVIKTDILQGKGKKPQHKYQLKIYYLKYFFKYPFNVLPKELFTEGNLFTRTWTWNVPPASAGSPLCYFSGFTLFI